VASIPQSFAVNRKLLPLYKCVKTILEKVFAPGLETRRSLCMQGVEIEAHACGRTNCCADAVQMYTN